MQFCVKRSGEYRTMYPLAHESFQDSASGENSPCFWADVTKEVILAILTLEQTTVSLNARVALMGWWKPSWCQCWIHSDMFTPQHDPCCETAEVKLYHAPETNSLSAPILCEINIYRMVFYSKMIYYPPFVQITQALRFSLVAHRRPLFVPVCSLLAVQTHLTDFQDIVFHP